MQTQADAYAYGSQFYYRQMATLCQDMTQTDYCMGQYGRLQGVIESRVA